MTTAQPGQEQRMEPRPCSECGSPCTVQQFPQLTTALWLCSNNKQLGGDCPLEWAFLTSEAWNRGSLHGLTAARPTADLGEDGDLVERVAAWLDKQRAECAPSTLVGAAISVDDLEGLIRIARAAPYKEALRQIHDHIAPRLGGDQYLVGEAIVKICRPLLASETIND